MDAKNLYVLLSSSHFMVRGSHLEQPETVHTIRGGIYESQQKFRNLFNTYYLNLIKLF